MTKQMTESTSPDDYLTKFDNHRTNRQNNFRNQFSRVIPTCTEWNSNDNLSLKKDGKAYNHRPSILQSPESIFKCRAHENLHCNECNIFGDEVRFSEPLVYNFNSNALENPDRMQWSSFDSGIRLPEPTEWITKVEISEHTEVVGTISEQYTDVCKLENDNDTERRHRWERNEMDYLGQDSFQNILAKLQESLLR